MLAGKQEYWLLNLKKDKAKQSQWYTWAVFLNGTSQFAVGESRTADNIPKTLLLVYFPTAECSENENTQIQSENNTKTSRTMKSVVKSSTYVHLFRSPWIKVHRLHSWYMYP